MDGVATLAIILSVISLCVSGFIGIKQIDVSHRANHIPAVIELLAELRSLEFHDNYAYVTTKLGAEHDPSLGISELPAPAKAAVLDIGYFFQIFACLVGFGVLDESKVIRVLRVRLIRTWKAIEPYVVVEREKYHPPLFRILQKFAEHAQCEPVYSYGKVLRFIRRHELLRESDPL